MPRNFAVVTPLGFALRDSGLTASRLSALTGIHPRTVTEHLSGRLEIRGDHLAAYSNVLGLAPEELTS
jgi:hypothetical protein